MIVAAFSTLGKTTFSKEFKGRCFDYEVNKMSKNAGFPGWDEVDNRSRLRLAMQLYGTDRIFTITFVTIPEICLYLPKGSDVIICIPKFGVEEFKRRLLDRGKPLDLSDEWRILGGNNFVPAIKRYRSIAKKCNSMGIHTRLAEVDYVSDLLSDANHESLGGNHGIN